MSRVVYTNGSYTALGAPAAELTNGGYDQRGGPAETVATFVVAGGLSAAAVALAVPMVAPFTLSGVRLAVTTAPVGAALLVDVNKNGTTVFTTQANRPAIADGATSGGPGAAPNVTQVVAGDLITIDVDQVGSGTAGSNLVVVVLGTRSGW